MCEIIKATGALLTAKKKKEKEKKNVCGQAKRVLAYAAKCTLTRIILSLEKGVKRTSNPTLYSFFWHCLYKYYKVKSYLKYCNTFCEQLLCFRTFRL